jgi:hypothetical protein
LIDLTKLARQTDGVRFHEAGARSNGESTLRDELRTDVENRAAQGDRFAVDGEGHRLVDRQRVR